VPIIAVELLNCGAGVVGRFEGDNSGPFGTTAGVDVDVGSNDGSFLGYNT
jgi:hypothetical protein